MLGRAVRSSDIIFLELVYTDVQGSDCTGLVWRSTGPAINTLSKNPSLALSYGMERRQQTQLCARGE